MDAAEMGELVRLIEAGDLHGAVLLVNGAYSAKYHETPPKSGTVVWDFGRERPAEIITLRLSTAPATQPV